MSAAWFLRTRRTHIWTRKWSLNVTLWRQISVWLWDFFHQQPDQTGSLYWGSFSGERLAMHPASHPVGLAPKFVSKIRLTNGFSNCTWMGEWESHKIKDIASQHIQNQKPSAAFCRSIWAHTSRFTDSYNSSAMKELNTKLNNGICNKLLMSAAFVCFFNYHKELIFLLHL